jgi:hypothetical protein
MPFKTDDPKTKEYSEQGVKAKEAIKGDRFKWIANKGMEKATDVIDDMLDGREVTKEQAEAVRLLEKFVGYERAKRMPENKDGESKMEIQITTI